MVNRDKASYEGAWIKGKKHGNGIFTSSEGVVTHEVWDNGKQVSFSRHDQIVVE